MSATITHRVGLDRNLTAAEVDANFDSLNDEIDTKVRSGVPAAFTSRALTVADDGKNLILASAQTATVNTGLPSGFGCSFKGSVSFAGSATVTDVRVSGAENPWCALVQTGANAYDVVGGAA